MDAAWHMLSMRGRGHSHGVQRFPNPPLSIGSPATRRMLSAEPSVPESLCRPATIVESVRSRDDFEVAD